MTHAALQHLNAVLALLSAVGLLHLPDALCGALEAVAAAVALQKMN